MAYYRSGIEIEWLGPAWDPRSGIRIRSVYDVGASVREVPPHGTITVPEAAELLDVSRVAALGYVKNKLIPTASRKGRTNMLRLRDVVDFYHRRQHGQYINRRLFPT